MYSLLLQVVKAASARFLMEDTPNDQDQAGMVSGGGRRGDFIVSVEVSVMWPQRKVIQGLCSSRQHVDGAASPPRDSTPIDVTFVVKTRAHSSRRR